MESSHLSGLSGRRLIKETVTFRGHPMVRATHPTTIEVTTEEHLTTRGDCIIGVGADRGCAQLSGAVKEALRNGEPRVRIVILVGGLRHVVYSTGDPGLELSNQHEMVIRRSSYLSDRTLALRADSAACDIPRHMVRLLTDQGTVGRLEIEVG